MTIRFHSVLDLEEFRRKMGIKGEIVRRPKADREHQHQVTVIKWRDLFSTTHPALARLHAIPNGGSRDKAEAKKLKAEGVTAGVADLFGPKPAHGYHGIYVELKDIGREKERRGGLSEEQLRFLTGVAGDGFFAAVAYGSNQAIDVLSWYYGVPGGCLSHARRIYANTLECELCGKLSEPEEFPAPYCSSNCRMKMFVG